MKRRTMKLGKAPPRLPRRRPPVLHTRDGCAVLPEAAITPKIHEGTLDCDDVP